VLAVVLVSYRDPNGCRPIGRADCIGWQPVGYFDRVRFVIGSQFVGYFDRIKCVALVRRHVMLWCYAVCDTHWETALVIGV